MPEMVAAVAVVIDRLPDWLWPLSIRASVHFHVICSYRQGESLAFRKQTAPYRPESMSQTLNAGSYLPNLLGIIGQPHSSTSSSMALIGRGRLRLLPLAATVQPKVSSPALRAFLAETRNPGLHRPPLRFGPAGASVQAPA